MLCHRSKGYAAVLPLGGMFIDFFFFLSLVEEVDFSFVRNKKIWYLRLWDKVFGFSNSMHSSVCERTKLFRQKYIKNSKPMFKWSSTDLTDVDPQCYFCLYPQMVLMW